MARIYMKLKRWQDGSVAASGDVAVVGVVLIASVALAFLGA